MWLIVLVLFGQGGRPCAFVGMDCRRREFVVIVGAVPDANIVMLRPPFASRATGDDGLALHLCDGEGGEVVSRPGRVDLGNKGGDFFGRSAAVASGYHGLGFKKT